MSDATTPSPDTDSDVGETSTIRWAIDGPVATIWLHRPHRHNVLFCDLRFGSAPAKLTTAAPKLGRPAEYGMSWTLPRLVGVTRANDLLLSGRVVTAAETADWGLWNSVEADGPAALDAAQRYARDLAASTGPLAVAATKRQIADDLLRHDPAQSVDDSIGLLDVATRTEEYAEGIAALRAKRPPNF